MNDEFEVRSQEYETLSTWVGDRNVCNHAIQLLSRTRNHLGSILDAGGGTGALSAAIAATLPHTDVLVLDSSPSMLSKVPERFKKVVSGIESVGTLGRCFQTILLRQVLHYLDAPKLVLDELYKTLDDDGVVYVGQIVAPNSESGLWLQRIASRISPSRRRVWEIPELMSLLLDKGLRFEGATMHSFSDSLNKWMSRSTVPLDCSDVMDMAKDEMTSGIRKSLAVLEEQGDILFKVLFFHGIFVKSCGFSC